MRGRVGWGKEKERRDHKSVDERMKLEMHRGDREGEDANECENWEGE